MSLERFFRLALGGGRDEGGGGVDARVSGLNRVAHAPRISFVFVLRATE